MKRWLLAVLVVTAPIFGCVDRVAGHEEEPTFPACATITATGYWHGGERYVIFDEQTGAAGVACVCMTEEEIQTGERDDEINDLAFTECTRLAEAYSGDSDWDDCEERYLAGEWISSIAFVRDETASQVPEDLTCSDDDSPDGCSSAGERTGGGVLDRTDRLALASSSMG